MPQSSFKVSFGKNLNALKLLNPSLFDLLENNTANTNYSIEKGKTGFYLQTPTFVLNSKIDPIREAQTTVQTLLKQNPSKNHFIVCGVELGYTTQALLSASQNTTIWVIEHDLSILKLALSIQDFSPFIQSKTLTFIYIPKIEGAEVYFQKLNKKDVVVFFHRASGNLYPEFYSKLKLIISKMLELTTTNANTISRFEKLWLSHTLLNLPNYVKYKGVDALYPTYQSKPTLVVGAGPSLQGQIQELKALQNRVLIICVSTSLSFLLENNITPHIVVAVDPQDKIFTHFIPLFQKKNLPFIPILVTEPTISAKIPRHYPGVTLFSDVSILKDYINSYLSPKIKIDSGGSVITTAYSLALLLKAPIIIFIGVDLSYTGKTMHFKGSELEKMWYFNIQNRFTLLEKEHFNYTNKPYTVTHAGFFGQDVFVDNTFKTYIDWLENRFGYYAETFKTYNATGGGVAFSNIPNILLGELMQSLNLPLLHLQIPKIEPSETHSLEPLLTNLKEILSEIEQITPLIKKGLTLYQETYKKAQKQEPISQNTFNALSKSDEKVFKMSSREIISLNIQKTIKDVTEENDFLFSEKEKNDPLLKNLRKSIILYNALQESCEFCIILINKLLFITR